MTVGTTTSTFDIVHKIVQDAHVEMSENKNQFSFDNSLAALKSPGSEMEETIKNMTSTSCSYSSSLDASRSHLRLKMSSGTSKPGLGLSSGRSAMKIPSLLQKLPCHGLSRTTSATISTNPASAASAVTLSALSVIERGPEGQETEDNYEIDVREELELIQAGEFSLENKVQDSSVSSTQEEAIATREQKKKDKFAENTAPVVDLDAIDLDNITIDDLHGLQVADGDTLRARFLNKLSRKEREYVLQDIHGVADDMEETNNKLFVDDSLKKLQIEIDHELLARKANKNVRKNKKGERKEDAKGNNQPQETSASTPPSVGDSTLKLPALEEQLGKLQEKLDQLVRRRNNLDSSINEGSNPPSRKQLSAKNHPMFGKLGDIGGFGSFPLGSNSSSSSKNNIRPASIPSSCFGGSSSFFSPTTAMAKSTLSPISTSITNEVQEDAAILNSRDAIAYEQALAQCRGRRRERNNSLFRPNLTDDTVDEDDDLDEGLYIDVEQREFRLSFLRAERYDIKKAATRFIDYFEEKRRLFGVNNLTTKIKLKDLDSQTKDCLESGQIQLLPGRDRAGRAVIVGTKKLTINGVERQDKKSTLRAFWILCSIALEDVETETNGVVFVKYAIGGASDDSNDGFHRRICDWGNILRALPLRVASIHYCVENYARKQAANLSALLLGGSNFVRVRCHAGSDMEVQYDLMTFGIPTDLFPVSMTGKINLSRHFEFLQQRKKMEASTLLNMALALVESPMLDDCIGIDVIDDEQVPESAIIAQASTATRGNRFPNITAMAPETSRSNSTSNFHRQNETQFQQEQEYQKQQELNRTSTDYGFNNMNKTVSSSFKDSFCHVGNFNQMQVQSSMQQQYQQRRQQQQRLNGFQQQNVGMNMNMGVVQQYSQSQQIQRQQQHLRSTAITAECKSGIAYSMEPVLVPGELDILLGRGRGVQNHKGNIHYRQVVETFRSRYEQIPQKGAKTQLIREVVAVIYDNGGRFLKKDSFDRWIPVDPEVVRDKVSHSFRNQKRLSIGPSTPMDADSTSNKRSRDEMK